MLDGILSVMTKKRIKIVIASLTALIFIFVAAKIFAATIGTIDPNNTGDHFAAFVHAPTAQSGSAEINFGKFTTDTADDITISDGSLSGYAWSPVEGWIVTNCANTSSGCTSSNQNFKVAVSDSGVLSGYAWGQQTGWINFGPFTNSNTPQVQINNNGTFGGTSGTAGYAWSETDGWIVFDCSNPASCTSTNYTVGTQATSSTGTSSGGTTSGGGWPIIQPSGPQQATAPGNPSSGISDSGTSVPATVSGGSPYISSSIEPTMPPPDISPQQPPVPNIAPTAIPQPSQPSHFNNYLAFLSDPIVWIILLLIIILIAVIVYFS